MQYDNTTVLDSILYRELSPFNTANASEIAFASRIREVKESISDYPFRYKIDYYRPFSNKTKFYSRLILKAVKEDTERIYYLISSDSNTNLILYWLNDTLNKKLKTRLKDLGILIKEKGFDIALIDPAKYSHDLDQEHKANTYIMHLLKLAYMQIYLEIQDAFSKHIDDILIIEDFYSQLLYEPLPAKHFLSLNQLIEIVDATAATASTVDEEERQFQSFKYQKLADCPDNLNDLFDNLKKNKFISDDSSIYDFKKIFSGGKNIKPVIWTGNQSDLFYFIKLIYTDHKLVKNLKQKQWLVACNCFIPSEGNTFNPQSLRKSKTPSLSRQLIENAVSLLK